MAYKKAPDFTLMNQHNQPFNLYKTLVNGPVVLFFYPKNDTPGCTKEACGFRDSFEEFTEMGVTVVGISQDSEKSHANFAQKYQLPYQLVSDKNNEVRKAFGVSRDLFGLLAGRTTFVINSKADIVLEFNAHFMVNRHIDEAKKILKKWQKTK